MSNGVMGAGSLLGEITGRWWVLLLRGIAALVVGFIAFVWPGVTLAALILLFAAYAIADGGLSLYMALMGKGERSRGWLLFEGVLGVAAGLVAIAAPGLTLLWLTVLMGGWLLARGAVEVYMALKLRREIEGEWALVLHGVACALFGLAIIAWPAAGALALAWTVGAFALFSGVLLVVLALRLRGLHARG
ncbi:MAG: DUF308 domain-containing protein [Rubritepida sp.]|jgi:uncharacterized membrane protein HdeD (DUF308 family)|nr:DUF308 domain-containing protein [Rubritepida sp.]